ncbi:MAG: AraC family transcriptional regulator [Prevotella sp.]|nr:AraC family transcriptional regulator [Prevotella sp.]
MRAKIYNLQEVNDHFNIHETFGAVVSCMTTDSTLSSNVPRQGMTVNCYSIVLIIDGRQDYTIDSELVSLEMHDLLILPPFKHITLTSNSKEVSAVHLLLDAQYYDEVLNIDPMLRSQLPLEVIEARAIYHLDESKAAEFYELFRQIRKAITQPHIYKGEMLRHLIHVLQLYVAEMIYGKIVTTHDIKHKENLFKIFIHLAARNFRKERQIKFYADQLSITPTYLSRTVKELSGNTVFDYLSSFLYNDICNLLRTTDLSISEIAYQLNFNDQSALSNFFKGRSGMSPLAYRKNKQP